VGIETACTKCGAAYVASREEILAGRWWLCPACRKEAR
jgi:predicted  nucleic acid-binding Zn-ribbon protein